MSTRAATSSAHRAARRAAQPRALRPQQLANEEATESSANGISAIYQRSVLKLAGVLRGQQYEAHEVDISGGKYPGLPYQYFGYIRRLLSMARRAPARILDRIKDLHASRAQRSTARGLALLPRQRTRRPVCGSATLAPHGRICKLPFPVGKTSSVSGMPRAIFVMHCRFPALVSGQCFARTEFQSPGAMSADFSMIAVYEQEGSPEEMRRSFETLPAGALDFPAMDLKNFAEWVYRPCAPQIWLGLSMKGRPA